MEETVAEKFKIIEDMLSRDHNLLNIRRLCEAAGVSRSGYYNWLKNKDKREVRNLRDQEDFKLIVSAYQHRGYAKGAKGIYMRLLHSGIRMNLKKIRRLMKKFTCPIRKVNPHRRMAKALKTDNVAKNLLERKFKQALRIVILTDITYLFYQGKKAYLSVMKVAYTNQVLSYVLCDSLEIDFVLETVKILLKKHKVSLTTETMIHSDQGVHYTSVAFRSLLNDKKLRQSMSKRGNCWDNAPQESFFGHMKDEIDIRECKAFEDIKAKIDDYMDYYNSERYSGKIVT